MFPPRSALKDRRVLCKAVKDSFLFTGGGFGGDVDGLIYVSDMSWTKKINHPAEAFKPGDTVPAAVIEVEAASRKLTLSVVDYFKNKEDAEWKSYLSAHKPNQATLGDVMPKLESE